MNKIKLGDVMDVKRGTSLSGDYYSTSGDLVRLTLGNFKYPDCGFKPNTAKDDIYFVGEVKPEYIMKKGDIITPLTEQVKGLLGNTATIPESDKYIQSGDIGKIIPDESMINKRFSYYLVSSPTVKKQLSAASQQTKIRHTSPDKIKDCIAFIPDLYQQKKIAHLLDTINLLIQTNDSAIKQLESMAKTIYDYWFLQFEFPNEEGKPYKSSGGKMVWNEELNREIPEGWDAIKFGVIANFVKGKIPSFELSDEKDEINSTPYVTIDVANDAKPMYCNPEKLISLNGETIMVMDGAASGDVYIGNYGILGSTFSKISSNRKDISDALIYMLLNSYNVVYKKANTGSTVPHANTNFIKQMTIAIPKNCSNVSEQFTKLFKKIENCRKENRELASLRDFLLPMLMNGQVTFKEEDE